MDSESLDAPHALINVRSIGAAGDGGTDDTAAIREAMSVAQKTGAAGIFLPAGVYMISDALYLPSSFRIVGASAGSTALKAVPGTIFPAYKPDPRTVDVRQRRTMLTTEGVGSVREKLVHDIAIERLTIDWSNCPAGGVGHSVVLMDSVDHAVLRDLAFVNAMPSDHPATAAEMREFGSRFRCECIMFSNARHGLMDRCRLTDSGYRPLSVAYGSRAIVFRGGIIHAKQPVWRHCFSETHGDGISRDQDFVRAQLYHLNSTFILDGGTPGDGICSHTGSTHVDNCDFYIRNAPASFFAIIRAFDGSRHCACVNSRFHCDGAHPAHLSIFTTTPRTNPNREHDSDILFAGNFVDISFGEEQNDRTRAVVQVQDNPRRVRIADNVMRIRWSGRRPAQAIRLEQARSFTITGNLIEIESETTDDGPDGVHLENCRDGLVTNNLTTGAVRHAVHVEGEIERVIAGEPEG